MVYSKPSLSVVIAAHVLDGNLTKCLKSVEFYFLESIEEVILVLDGVRRSDEFFKAFNLPGLKVLELESSHGPAYARNFGAHHAKSNVLFFIDSDIEVKKDTFEKVINHFGIENSEEAIIGSYDDSPEDQALISKYRNLLHHFTHQHASEKAMTFWGACGAIRKEVFLLVGGFDESFTKPSVEDIDLGYRLVQKGFAIRLYKELQVKHLKRWTFILMVKTDVFQRAKPWAELLFQYKKWGTKDLNVNNSERLAVFLLGLGVSSLIAAFFLPVLAFIGCISLISLLLVKRKTYAFFSKYFSVRLPLILLLYWMYLLSGAVGLVLGAVSYALNYKRKTKDTSGYIMIENSGLGD